MTERDQTAPTLVVSGGIAGDAGLHIIGATIDPVGPVNVFNDKIIAADAINRAIAVKAEYDAAHPPAAPLAAPDMRPIGQPISAGRAIPFNKTKFVIDPAAGRRVNRKRWFK